MRARFQVAGLAFVAAVLGGCKGDTTAPAGSVTAVISAVRLAGTNTAGTLQTGALPTPAGGPILSANAQLAAVNGGSSAIGLTGSEEFTTVVVGVQGQPDYFVVTLPASETTADIVVTLQQALPVATFQLTFAVGQSVASLGDFVSKPLSIIAVGTGDVQVSISWDSPADVDLHVVDPSGEEIYYGNKTSPSGGELDLDSNAACSSDTPRNENITWPQDGAPSGEYIVRVDYWSACDATETNYVVTVQVRGQDPQTFIGTFTGTGDGGGLGSGEEIVRFTR
jgi:hypothetical protein